MTFAVGVRDPAYPQEWRYNDAGWPICTAFAHDDEEFGEQIDPRAAVRDLFEVVSA